MCARNAVVSAKVGTYTYGYRFLTYIQMDGSGHEVLSIQLEYFLFKVPNSQHLTIHIKQLCFFHHKQSAFECEF